VHTTNYIFNPYSNIHTVFKLYLTHNYVGYILLEFPNGFINAFNCYVFISTSFVFIISFIDYICIQHILEQHTVFEYILIISFFSNIYVNNKQFNIYIYGTHCAFTLSAIENKWIM